MKKQQQPIIKDKLVVKHLSSKSADEVINQSTTSPNYPRKSLVTMTKYEHAKVIGIRAEQLARGAQPFVIDEEEDQHRFDPIALAQRELDAGVLPFVVIRNLPDGTQEKWKLRDLVL